MTVIDVLTCCCVPNFIKIGSRVRPPDVHNYRMFNASLLGNRIVGDMTWCDHPSWVSVGPLIGELWHFEYFPTWRPSAILNFKNFNINHVTVIAVLTCCCVPNFIKIGSRIRSPDAHNCWMYNSSLLGNGRCHGNRITTKHDGMWPPNLRPSRSVGRRVMAFRLFCNMAAVRHFEF